MEFYRSVQPCDRTVEANWQLELRDELLRGHVPIRNLPRILPSCAKVYLSAVNTDSECERRHLIDELYIKLREYCRAAHGIEFQVVDLHSGVERQSAHILPSITEIRKFEIKQCQQTSTGPCFVALIGQRFCTEAIPPLHLGQDEFEARRNALADKNHDVTLLDKYYLLDENSIPPTYTLRPNLIDTNKWVEIERRMSELLSLSSRYLQNADWSNPPSDLEVEIHAGVLSLDKQKFRDDNCIILRRKITDIGQKLSRKRVSRFIDLVIGTNEVDSEAQSALSNLLSSVRSCVTKNNFLDFEVKWSEPFGIESRVHKDHLKSVGSALYEKLRRHIDICMIEWGHYPTEPLYVEVLQHWLHTRTNLEHFYEQGQYLHSINRYITSQSNKPMIVHGVSGSGKSAILSKIAAGVKDKSESLRVILRHLGRTPASSDIEQLLESLLEQLSEVMKAQYIKPKSFLEAKTRFKNIMESGHCNCTLLLIIDGLDQLRNSGYDRVDWLPLKLSPNIKMVVSLTEADSHQTFDALKSRYVDKDSYIKVDNMLPETCEWIVENRLSDVNRRVTPDQWKRISKSLHECPYPLYIELMFQQIIRWKSYDYPLLPDSIQGMITLTLNGLESRHGHEITRHILAIITCSNYGLTEAEIEDILSLDDEILSLYHVGNSTPLVQRIPCVIWSKLKYDLEPYLSVWKVDGVNLVTWRYSQFAEVIKLRYLEDKAFTLRIHSLIADFFSGSCSGINKKPYLPNQYRIEEGEKHQMIEKSAHSFSSHRNVISQPLLVTGHGTVKRVNVRKLNELALHLAKSGRIEELKTQILYNYLWMHTKLSAMPATRLIEDFGPYNDDESLLVKQALEDIKVEFDPDILSIELTGRLLPYYSRYPNIRSLIDQCDLESMRRCFTVPKLQLYETPGSFLQYGFRDLLQGPVTKLQVTKISRPDTAYIVTKQHSWSYALLRNVTSHEETRFNGLPGKSDIYITPDQRLIVAKRGRNIEAYQIDSRQLELSVPCEEGLISCSSISDGHFIFSLQQKLGPFVVDLKYPSLVHRFNHHTTAVGISEDSTVLVCNDDHTLHVYVVPLMTRQCSITLDDTACKILFLADPYKFCVLSSSHYVRMYTLHSGKRIHHTKVLLQEPSIIDIKLSQDKSTLLIHSKKYIKLFNTKTGMISACINELAHITSQHNIASADFNADGSYVIACRERSLGVYQTSTGSKITEVTVPFPCDIWTSLVLPTVGRVATILENGLMNIWNLEFVTSDKKHQNRFYPGELTSFSVSQNGSYMAVSNSIYPDAKVVDCSNGEVIARLYDSFAAGSQPISVKISPCGQYVVTRCSNEAEGTIDWPVLYSDYVWSIDASRVTHFFINSYAVVFSDDDQTLVDLSCVGYSAADPSNKFFIAQCYKTVGDKPEEHKTILPDGDLIGQPIVYNDKKWLVCLIQPCVKTKFSGMVMEQRVDNIQLYVFDIFTQSARERRFINCADLINEKRTFFIQMKETTVKYQLLLVYARGALPPYTEEGVVDVNYHMSKGYILYDLLTDSVQHHLTNLLTPETPIEDLLFSKQLKTIIHDFTVYDAQTSRKIKSITPTFQISDTISPVLLLDGHYMALVTACHKEVKFMDCRNGSEVSHLLIHGEAVHMSSGEDDRTLYISTSDGRVMILVCVLELCDPVTMLVRHLPSRRC